MDQDSTRDQRDGDASLAERDWELSLADIAFLANSENRVAVLRSLLDGPHARHVVQERTGVSRVTLGRILDELVGRRWITRRGQVCEVTPLGEWVVEAVTRLAETLTAERRLRDVFEWFPDPGYGFHVSHLADAEITRISPADASAPITALVQQLAGGGTVRAFSFAITSQFLAACWRHALDGDIDFHWVFTTAVLDVLQANAAMARQARELLESGRAAFYHHPGAVPYVVVITEAAANLRLADRDGAATALIRSTDPTVRAWAETAFEAYREAATPVDAAVFTG